MKGTVRADRYAERHWLALTDQQREDVIASIPDGHFLSLTHGGRNYAASLRQVDVDPMDNDVVDVHHGFTLWGAIERLLRCQFETTVTLDGAGYVKAIEP